MFDQLAEHFFEYLEKDDTRDKLHKRVVEPLLSYTYERMKYAVVLGELALLLLLLQVFLSILILRRV